MQAQKENIRKGNFCFPKYGILVSQSNVDTTAIGKLEQTGKITLHVISQG